MKQFIAIALGCLLLFSGCLKEDPQVPAPPATPVAFVKLSLEPRWNGGPFDKTNTYLTAANERVLIQLVKFFLSGIRLKGASGEHVLSTAELIEITNGADARVFKVAPGSSDSLLFGLGLPVELNHADISSIDPTTPLGNNTGMYWTWNTMYRFLLFDGRYDTDPNGTGVPPYLFSIHTGRDECYREGRLALPLTTTANDTSTIVLQVDLARFFTDGSAVLDLSQGPQSHGEVQGLPIAEELSDLAVKAITLP
jgi:hypothetical protein